MSFQDRAAALAHFSEYKRELIENLNHGWYKSSTLDNLKDTSFEDGSSYCAYDHKLAAEEVAVIHPCIIHIINEARRVVNDDITALVGALDAWEKKVTEVCTGGKFYYPILSDTINSNLNALTHLRKIMDTLPEDAPAKEKFRACKFQYSGSDFHSIVQLLPNPSEFEMAWPLIPYDVEVYPLFPRIDVSTEVIKKTVAAIQKDVYITYVDRKRHAKIVMARQMATGYHWDPLRKGEFMRMACELPHGGIRKEMRKLLPGPDDVQCTIPRVEREAAPVRKSGRF